MKTGREVAEWLAERIIRVGERPLMFGGTAEGVDLCLDYFHETLAVCLGIEEEYQSIRDDAHAREGCDSANFAFHYRRDRPDASEAEVARYVVERWVEIGDRLTPDLFREARARIGPLRPRP